MLKRRNKKFVSELDKFLAEFDQKNSDRSNSQMSEFNKHQRIAALRDVPQEQANKDKIWKGF